MMRLVGIPVLMGLLVGCGSEGTGNGTDQAASSAGEAARDADLPTAAGSAEQARSAAPRPGTRAGERPDAEPVVAQIFDEVREAAPPPRVTYHVFVARDATRDQLRRTLSDLLLEEAEADTSLVAARAIGYYGVQTSATEADMVPFVWAEWLPPDGWYRSTDASRDAIHRVYFYPETPPQW